MRLISIFFLIVFSSFQSYGRSAPDSFAALVDDLIPAVVSIASTTIIKQRPEQLIPEFPEGSPFEEFFRDYFNREQRKSPSQRPLVGLGSGFILDESGIVVTNNHVIEAADEISVIMFDQKEYKAELLGRDPKADLAVLKINTEGRKLKSVKWGDSDTARVGDWTIAIGNPLGLGGTVTAGIISAISRDIGGGPYVKFIQTDASINRGNSGGPLFNIQGEVIGINAAIISHTGGSIGLGFAIPSNSAKKIISQLREFGRTKRGWLGVEITKVTKDIAESLELPDTKGAFVSSLNPEGPSKKAGIQEGDVILKFNNIDVTEMIDLPRLVAESDIDSLAKVEVWRKVEVLNDKNELEKIFKSLIIEVKLGELAEKNYAKEKSSKDDPEISNETKILDLGISISSTKNDKGVIVTKQTENEKLLVGDIIIEVNREEITSVKSFNELINEIKKTGRASLLLKIIRNNQSLWITIKFKN